MAQDGQRGGGGRRAAMRGAQRRGMAGMDAFPKLRFLIVDQLVSPSANCKQFPEALLDASMIGVTGDAERWNSGLPGGARW
jgi:hypothetical protein